MLFIFTRSWFALEQLFCVVPVVANVRLEIMGTRCALSWRRQRHDLLLDVESVGLLDQIQQAFLEALQEGLVFHEEQSALKRTSSVSPSLQMRIYI